jgi:putative aldouronate transport system permease protein
MITKTERKPINAQRGFRRTLNTLKREKHLWLLVLPGLIWYLIFCYGPMSGLVIAFQDFSPFRGIANSKWVGFMWFKQFFDSQFVWRLISNTILLNFYNVIFSFPVPIILALLLNEVQHNWYKKAAQTISYLPHFVSTVVVVGMMANFLSPVGGIVNLIIESLGGEKINFLIKPEWFRTLYISSGIWQGAGWGSIIYLAALSGIDVELYEAAIVDGANKWKQLWYISIPGILPTIIIMLIMNLGHILSVGYEKIILLYNSATYETADVINTYVYRRGIVSGEYSFGTAVGLFQSVINFIFVIAANRLSRKLTDISLW